MRFSVPPSRIIGSVCFRNNMERCERKHSLDYSRYSETMQPTKSLYDRETCKFAIWRKLYLRETFFTILILQVKRPRQPLNRDLLPLRRLDLVSTHNSRFIFHLNNKFSFCASRVSGVTREANPLHFMTTRTVTLCLIEEVFENFCYWMQSLQAQLNNNKSKTIEKLSFDNNWKLEKSRKYVFNYRKV